MKFPPFFKKAVRNATYFLCFILIALCAVPLYIVHTQEEESPVFNPADAEDAFNINAEFREFMDKARHENYSLRETLMNWSLAILGVLTMVALATVYFSRKEIEIMEEEFNTLGKEHKSKFEEKEKVLQDIANKYEEKEKGIQETINKYELFMKNAMGPLYSFTEDEITAFKERNDLYIILKAETNNNKCEHSPCRTCGVFSEIINKYHEARNDATNAAKGIESVIKILESMISDEKYKKCAFKINHFLGYIYNDDSDAEKYGKEQLKNKYKKAIHYYNECLKIDKTFEERYLFVVYNDLGYAEMQLASFETSIQAKKDGYKNAMGRFIESISLLKRENLKWAYTYKNIGKCLGKMALLESNNEDKEKLFLEAETWYHMAYSLFIFPDQFDLINKSFIETKRDYNNFIRNKKSAI